jgi:hypothetical protein
MVKCLRSFWRVWVVAQAPFGPCADLPRPAIHHRDRVDQNHARWSSAAAPARPAATEMIARDHTTTGLGVSPPPDQDLPELPDDADPSTMTLNRP